MRQYRVGLIELRILESPRIYLRVWRLVLMYWPREPWHKRLEVLLQ